MNQGNRRRGQPAPKEEPKAKEDVLRKDITRAQLKGATKAMAGLAKKPAPPPKKKKSLKATSRLFMKFRQMNPRRSKKGHFKAASKLLTGFRKKFAASTLLNKKKKSAAMLKNTSKLMLGLRKSIKKQPTKPTPSDGTKQKPTFMLIRLGPKAKVLTKVSAAASWLTKKFLSKKRGYSENDKAIQEAWLSRMGAQKLPFPTQDEFRRYQANLQRFPGAHRFYGQNEDVYGHPKNFEAYRHQRFPTQRYTPQGPGRYDDPSMEYYDYDNEESGFDNQGYEDYENRFPYGYDSYPVEEEGYDDYSGYQMDEDYPLYDDNMEYYDEESHLLKSQNSRFEYQVDVHNPPNAYSGYDFEENEMGYYGGAMNPYGTMENERKPFSSYSDQSNYSDFNDMDEYSSTNATNYNDYLVSPYAEPLNPYAQPMDETMAGCDENYYEDQDIEETSSTLSINRKYKLFPRPQVRLFGREKLDVPLPPSPQDDLEPLIPPPEQQRNYRQPPNKSLFAKSVQRNSRQPCARGVQKLLSSKPVGKRFSVHHQENYQENESQDFSPRAFGSPLGQFMKKTLDPKPILKHSGIQRKARPPSEPPNRNAFPYHKRFGLKLAGMESSNFSRKLKFSASNNNNTEAKPSPQPIRQSPQPGKDVQMPPSPNLSTRQRPLSPKPAMNAFGLNKSDANSHIQQGHINPPMRSSLRQKDLTSSPYMATVPRSPSPTRMTHWASNAKNQNASSTSHSMPSHIAPPSPQPSIRSNFRGEQGKNLSPQMSIKSMGTPAHQLPGLRPQSDRTASPYLDSPLSSPVLQRSNSTLQRGFGMPASPQPTRRNLDNINSDYYSSNESDHEMSFPQQMSGPMGGVVNDQQERFVQGWPRDNEPPTEAVKPLIRGSLMRHLKQSGVTAPSNPLPQKGSMSRMSLSREGNMRTSPPPQRQASSNLMGRESPRPPSPSRSFTEQPPDLGRYDSMRSTSKTNPSSPIAQMINRRENQHLLSRDSQESPKSAAMGRHVIMAGTPRIYDSIRGASNRPPSSPITHMLQKQGSSPFLSRKPPPVSLQPSTSFSEQPQSPIKTRFDSIRGMSNLPQPNTGTDMLHRQDSILNSRGFQDGSLQVSERPKSPVMKKNNSLRGNPTYIGSILLSMNPYKMLNIYGTDHVLKYEGKALGENPPHLFAIANVAYTKLMDAKNNQCIIISGESGSGKTEATKLVLRYLVAVNQRRGVTSKILEATPLLESFGNAKTVRNDNSSRFGKFIEIYLEEGVICGAITSQYLLEKSRIVFQAKNERNYHIFYEMLAGLPSQQKQMFYLQDAETYYYLNQGGNCDIPAKSDADDFRRLLNAMESLSFTGEDQDSIFRILSSILHLGNVYFEKYETESQEIASVVSASEIRVVAELLQISPEGLQKAITYKVTECIFVCCRDAIAKILYSLLFSWLTDRINKLVYPKQDALSIAILDIYGFEDLSFNSFEQLCINYANEYLQFFFNKIIFKEEQEEYIREQIDWREISFSDNQACIDIISQKPHGILRILDDQSCFPQATDHTFLQKCHYHHGTNDLYCKPKMPLPEFGIKHFAGKVTYQVHKFLDKNYDQVRQDVLDLFVNSRIKVVANLFFSHAQVLAQQKTMMGKSNTVTRKYKASTVAAKFQQSLLELVEKMERCNPFFVRCIKPNSRKEPSLFESDIVTSQLKYSGILETIRIRKEGFPVRIPFHFFLSRYRCVMDLGPNVRVDGQICVTVLKKLCPSASPSMYCIGVSKLFMKENVYQQLESKRDLLMNKAAVTLQRYSRGYLTRRRYYILRYRIIQLQAVARGYLARKIMMRFRAVVNIYVNRRKYLRELTKREVVNVTHLELPAELAGLLPTKNLTLDFVLPIQCPQVEADSQLTLPLDINNYLMFKYVRVFFKEPLFGMLTVPLGSSLLPVEDDLRQHAISSFKLILRFMGDPYLGGTQEMLFGNYIVQKGLSNTGLRDEILAQIGNQVWRNTNPNNEERGWYLLACCLSTFAPSPNLDKYLLKYVSDYAYNGYKPVCQHKLIQAIQKSQQGSETARNFPPSLLEWTASRERANMAIDIHCFDGAKISCPIHSWTDGEEIAGDVLRHRGVIEGFRGWSVSLKEGGQWTELAGQDYVLDLICNMELPREFPKQKSYFITASEATQENSSQGEAGDAKVGAYLHEYSDSVSEPQSQKGMDHYLDSLFDPVLSYGNGVSELLVPVSVYRFCCLLSVARLLLITQREKKFPQQPHFPEPSHNIKDIINRYKQPGAIRQPAPVISWLFSSYLSWCLCSSVAVNRELSEEQENIQTQLHRQYSEEYYTYTNVPWRIYIRKEVFYPRDSFNNPLILDLIFKQVRHLTGSLLSWAADFRLGSINAIADDSVKKKIVTVAREELEVYFSRLFPAAGSVGTGVQFLGVSHVGIKLLKLLRSGGSTPEQLRVLRSYSYTDIMFVTVLSKNMLEFNLTNEKLILFSSRSSQVKTMIDCFLMELKKDSNYVVAVQNYVTEDKTLLSFHKGDIIRLQPLDGLKKGQNYGCVVRKKVMYLEELKRGTQDFGWKFGAIHSRAGVFPAECVQPVAAPDFVNLPADRKEEPRNRQSRAAASMCPAGIMKFMGDLPLKGQSELDAVCSILKLCGEHEVMKDEGYCQIMKQITDNTSGSTDSCQRGWRLLFILTAYYKCSEVLKPYLFKFLQETCRSPGLHYQGIAKACEQNLRKTIQYGGRIEYPSAIELKAMVAGRSSKRQLFLLPGGVERHLKIKTCSVAFDVIEEICMEMGVHKEEAFHEYAIFAVTNRGQNVRPLNRKEYILDVSAEMEQTDSNYMFWFRRIIWAQQMKFENELYVTMHYNQVLPDYLKGLFNVVSHMKTTEQQFQQISRLAALQHRAKDSVYLPTAREVQDYIPSQFYKALKPQSWLNMVMQHMQQIQPLSPHQGRLTITLYNYGPTSTPPELVVIFPLNDIQSTRTQRPASGFSYPYVDVMLGDVTSQRITQLQLEQGLELCRVVATHMENLLQSRDKRLTLPPSEITLL
uniref:Myosin XVA n=1 Tax=Xenopus tropicalis TaxID=8364 RepID=A0A6I8Q197_XENTR